MLRIPCIQVKEKIMENYMEELVFLGKQKQLENYIQKNTYIDVCNEVDHLVWQQGCLESEINKLKMVLEGGS